MASVPVAAQRRQHLGTRIKTHQVGKSTIHQRMHEGLRTLVATQTLQKDQAVALVAGNLFEEKEYTRKMRNDDPADKIFSYPFSKADLREGNPTYAACVGCKGTALLAPSPSSRDRTAPYLMDQQRTVTRSG